MTKNIIYSNNQDTFLEHFLYPRGHKVKFIGHPVR